MAPAIQKLVRSVDDLRVANAQQTIHVCLVKCTQCNQHLHRYVHHCLVLVPRVHLVVVGISAGGKQLSPGRTVSSYSGCCAANIGGSLDATWCHGFPALHCKQ